MENIAGQLPEFVPLDPDCFLNKHDIDFDQYVIQFLGDVEPFHSECSKSLDDLFQYIGKTTGLTVKRVVKGGSLGKGTSIVGHSDITITLYLADFRDSTDFRNKLPTVTRKIYKTFQKSTWAVSKRKIRMKACNDESIEFKMECELSSDAHNVCIMPAYEALSSVPKLGDLKRLYTEMSQLPPNERTKFYNGIINEVQFNFVKKQPKKVKNLIRIVKHWMELCFDNTYTLPPYLVECVVIKCWELAGKPDTFDMVQGLKSVFETFKSYKNELGMEWNVHYTLSDVNGTGETARPYVFDPCNPFMDLCYQVNSKSWREMSRGSIESLQRPLFEDVNIIAAWKKAVEKPNTKVDT